MALTPESGIDGRTRRRTEAAAVSHRPPGALARCATALLRPELWWCVVGVVALAPLVASATDAPPLGRPWYLGRVLALAAGLAAALVVGRGAVVRSQAADRRWHGCLAPLVFLLSYAAFTGNYRAVPSGDNLATKAMPGALLRGDGFDLERSIPRSLRRHYAFVRVDDRLLNAFPLGTGLVATPLYALASLAGDDHPAEKFYRDHRLEKLASALLVALSVTVFFSASRALWSSLATRLAATGGLALATPFLTSLSQGLWSFTGEALFLALALAAATHAPGTTRCGAAAGAALGAAFVCRPTAVLVAPLVAGALALRRRSLAACALAAALVAAAAMACQFALYGHPLAGYARINSAVGMWAAGDYFARLAGVLASPSRGLLWFFPALVVALFALRAHDDRSRSAGPLRLGGVLTVTLVVAVTAAYTKWWGGHSLGPRLLSELALPAAVLTGFALDSPRRRLRVAVAGLLLLLAGLGLRLNGSERAHAWNGVVEVDENPGALWSLRGSVLAAALVPGWSYDDPRPYFRGSARKGAAWEPVDLSPVARSRYDLAAVEESAAAVDGLRPQLSLPRLGAASLAAASRSGFEILPPGRANVVRLCADERLELDLDPLGAGRSVRHVHTLMLWRQSGAAGPGAGRLVVHAAAGPPRLFPLRVGAEVFDPTTVPAAPDRRLVAGRPADSDEIVEQRFSLRARSRVRAIELHGPASDSAGCLFVLALSTH